jgi:hypothetical protein
MFNVRLGANGVNCPIGRHVFFLFKLGVRYAGLCWDQWPKDLEHLEHVKMKSATASFILYGSLWDLNLVGHVPNPWQAALTR